MRLCVCARAFTMHICSFALCSSQLHFLREWQSTDYCTIITHTRMGDAGQAALACSLCLLGCMRVPSGPAVPVNCAKRGLAETLGPNKPQLAVPLHWSDKKRTTQTPTSATTAVCIIKNTACVLLPEMSSLSSQTVKALPRHA